MRDLIEQVRKREGEQVREGLLFTFSLSHFPSGLIKPFF